MRSKKSVFATLKWLLSLAFVAFAFMACEIGLGDAVDTLPPEVSISGPVTNSILRDEFVISGVCSDDTGVKTVTVELKNTELDKTYEVISVTPDKENWQVSLNKRLESGKYPFSDGKYDVTVHAYDFQGKDSGPRNISIVIDNTPPLLVLNRPSSGDIYGQKFDITGQVADDSNIDLVEVLVYSKKTDELLRTIQLKNVPPTIDLSAAVFGDEAYSEIYGTNKEDGDKEYYCEIKAYDAARKYPEEAGDKGNETSFFYMNEDIFDLMQSYKLTELYHIQNGLFTRSASTDEALNILSIPEGQEGSIRTKRNGFTLNPLNNPYFELNRFGAVTTFGEITGNDIHSEKALEIKVNVGKDNIILNDESFEVYAKRVIEDGTGWTDAQDEEEKPAVVKLYPMFENTVTKNGSNRNINIDLSNDYGFVVGERYILDVKGKDKNGNDIFNNGVMYGFYMGFSGNPPTLKVTNPSTNTVYMNGSGKIELAGATSHEEQKPKVFARFTKEGEEDVLATIELPVSLKEKTTYDFAGEILPAAFIAPEDINTSETYTMSVYAVVDDKTSSLSQINVKYDVVNPTVTVSSVLPLADTSVLAGGKEYNVNGNISIKVSFNDDETSVKSAGYRYTDKNNQTVEKAITKTSGTTITIDTNDLRDKADLDVVFFAEDQAGNTVEYVPVYDDSDDETADPKYFVDQETDKPLIVIEESQIRKTDSHSSENISILSRMASVTGTVSDDDGLEKYKIVLYRVDSENGAVDEESVSEINADNLGGVLTKQFTLQMPNENNIYKMVISATDKKKVDGEIPVTNEWVSFVKVAGGAPTVSITSGNKGIVSTAGQKNSLTFGGKFSGAHTPGTNKEKHLRIFLLENTEAAKNDSSAWVELFDAADVDYGTDALTKEWNCTLPVNSLPSSAKSEGEHTVLIRVQDGNGNVSDDTLSYSVDDTRPNKPSVDQISETITSLSYQFRTTSSDNNEGSGISGLFYQISETEKSAASASELTAANGWKEVSGNESFSFYQTFVGAESETVPAGQLREGVYTLYMYAVDNAGNISDRADKGIIADFTLPEIKDSFYVGKPETVKLVPQGTIIIRKPTEAEAAVDEALSTEFFKLTGTVTDTLKVTEVILRAEKDDKVMSIRLSDKKNEDGEETSLNPVVTKTVTKWDWSIDLPFDFFEDGSWAFNYKVFDQSGSFTEQKATLLVDTTAPSFSEVTPATPKATIGSGDSAQNWYNTTAVNYSVTVADVGGSGVSNVQYKKNSEETWNDMTPSTTQGVYTGTIILSDQGQNTIYFRAADVAGNYSSNSSVSSVIYIDTKLPEEISLSTIDGEAFSGRKLANGQKDISFVAAIKDTTALSGTSAGNDASGISSVKLMFDGVESAGATVTSSGSSYTITVPKDLISASEKTMVQVGVRVTDNVENSFDKNLFSLNIDTTPPSDIKISELMDAEPTVDGYTVNKSFTISGTASDDQSLEKVELQYKIGSDWTTYISGSGDSATSVIGSYTWTATIDSTNTTFNGKTFKIRLKATDSAGNISYGPVKDGIENYPEIIVDQDSDIPVITVDGMKADGGAFISQRKITGSVEDDDGNINFTNFKISEDGINWNSVTQLGTSRWSYTLSDDGSYTLYFKVTDAAGNEFSDSSSQKIVIKGDDNTASTTGTLVFTVDTKDPDVSADLYKGSTKLETQADRKYSAVVDINAILKITAEDANGLKEIGAYIGTRAEDDSNVDKKTDNLESGTEYELNIPLPDDDDLQAATVLTYYAEDKSGRVSSHTYTITVDNVAPSLTVSLPSSTTSIAGDTTVSGSTSDGEGGTGINTVKWFIPTNQQVSAWASNINKDALFVHTIDGTYTWQIDFNADKAGKLQSFYSSTVSGGVTTWHNYPAGGNSSATYGELVTGSTALYDLPIYFRIEDNVGNVTYKTDYTVRVNPDGDRPVATILYPTLKEDPTTHVKGPDTLSGSVRINGDASDEVDEVKEVHIQIQKSKDNSNTTTTEWEDVTGYSDVLATGTYKWNYSFDSSESVFDPVGDDATATHLRFRAWAKDAKGLVGDKSEWTVIRTDKDNPLIGKTNKLRIVKYKNDTASTSTSDVLSTLEYEEGMYVSGTVFLEFSVEDASGLKEITAGVGTNSIINSMDFVPKNGEPVTSLVKDSEGSHTNQPAVSEGYYGYDKVRVKLVTTGSGNLNFTVRAVENTDNNYSSTRDIKLRYDNTNPTLENLKHSGDDVGLGEGKVTVKQSNATYSLKSVINENDSGLAQLFMFWTRTKSGTTDDKRVYDPRKSENNVFYSKGDSASIEFNDDGDGLPYRRYTSSAGLSSSTTSSFTLSVADPFLTVANYVLIDGTYRKVSAISGITYTFTPETSPSTVDAIYAIAVDNERTEAQDLSSGDDGDGIWESLVDAGSTYEWEMNFNSMNIPDGPITISCIAIDNAGNKSALQETKTKIENNAPRIAKVMLGTDLNKDKTISKSEITVYNRYKEENNLTDVADLSSEIALDTNGYTVKSGFAIIPEFVGGNGSSMMMVLKRGVDGKSDGKQTYTTYLKPDSSASTDTKGDLKVSEFTSVANVMTSIYTPVVTGPGDERSLLSSKTNNVRDRVNSSFKKYFLTNAELFGTGTIANTASGSSEKIGLTFWDATEETVQGTDSQTAVLYLTNMKYEMVDNEAPKVVIKPFKWENKDDNSLYNNSTTNGHIELEDDLSGGTWTGYTVGAPKVSGKIVFRGTAYDNVGLTKLKFAFGSSSNANAWIANNITATYANGSWSYTSNGGTMTGNSPDGWTLIVKDVIQSTDKNFSSSDAYFGQDGHKVAWEFALDTEKWTNSGTNPAAIGAKLTVTAEDNSTDNSGGSNSSNETASTAAQEGTLTGVALDRVKNKSVYVVDIVPYVTSVGTRFAGKDKSIKGSYSRTSSGKYIVASDETGITLSGFNLTGGSVVFNGTDESATITNSAFSIPTAARTGAFKVVVNNVDSINNTNNNNAAGGSGKTISDTSSYSDMTNYAYNRCPNNISNNLLTDDLWFDIWELNSRAATSRGALKDPVMHINQGSTDKEIGFGFVNSADGVSFPAGGNSYVWFQKNRKDYKGTNFVYDNKGVAHNISIGLDAQASTGIAGRMNYNNSNWYSTNSYGSDAGNNGEGTISQWNLRYNIALETIGIPKGVNLKGTTLSANIIDTDRFVTPSIAVSTHGDNKTPTVYIMYYDTDHQQIRFRYGEINQSGNLNANSRYRRVNNNDQYESYGLLNDSKSENHYASATSTTTTIPSDTVQNNNTWANHNMFEASKDYYALVAGQYYKQTNNDKTAFDTGNKGSAYYGLDVVPGTAIGDDKVVMIWYDESTQNLMYMYRENLTTAGDNTDASSNGVANKWSKPVALVEDTLLQDCVIKVDSKGGIHIAYYDQTNADLIYGYMSGYNKASEFTTCVVDAYSQVGNRISIDSAVHATNGKVVPYISYFSDGLSSLPKMAYLPNGVSSAADVVDGANPDTTLFTGDWEVTLIPTASVLQPYNVGIGVWKDADNKATKQTKKTDVAYSATNYNQKCYANGSSELVVGYSIKQSGIGYMETAMRR